MSRLKYLFFLILFLFSSRINSQSPNWNSLLIIPSKPSPYISDWENNPNNITYSLQYLGQGSATVTLEFTVESDKLGELLRGSSQEIELNGPEQRDIRGTELVDWNATTWNKSIETQVIRTGKFPEGNYTGCISAYDANDNLLTESCVDFAISYPDPPYLIAPLSGDSVATPYPTFQWSPVIDTYSNDPIIYSIRIVELLKGQTPQQAILADYTHYEEKINITTLSYPPSALPLEKNKTYVWQVTALDENDVPITSNNGESEIWTFKYKDNTSSSLLSLYVNFTKNTISYSPNNLSNSVDIDLLLQGSTTETLTIDSVVTYWYNKNDNSLYKVMHAAISPIINLTSGLTFTRNANLTLDKASLSTALAGKQKTEYYVNIVYIGKDQNGNRITGKTQTPLNVICLSGKTSNLQAEFSDNTITYTPDNLSNTEKINLFYQAESNETVTIDSVITYWFNKDDNSLYKTMKETISPVVTLTGGSTVIRNANLTLDNASLTTALAGKQKAEYYVNIEYIGKDKNKNRTVAKTNTPLNVVFLANSLSGLQVEFVNKTIIYTPDTLSNFETTKLSFKSSEPQTLTIDSLVNYWYRKKDNSLYAKIKAKAIPIAVLTSGLTITRQSSLTLSYADLTTALQGQSTAEYYVHIEYIGKDTNGQRITGKTKTPLLVKLSSQSENQNNLVEFITKEIEYTPNILQNKVKIKFTHYANLTSPYIEVDSCIYYWYKENNNLFFKDKDQTSFQPFKVDYTPSVFEIEPSFDFQSFTNALDGKDSANYKLHIEYIGKEKDGKRVTVKTKTPLLVKFYGQTENQNNLVEFITKEIKYAPNILQNKVKIKFTHYANLTSPYIEVDSCIYYWYKENNNLFFKEKYQKSFQPFKVDYTPSVFEIEPYFDLQSFTNALEGKDSANYKLHIEYIGKEKDGKRVTVRTKLPLIVKFFASKQQLLNAEYSQKVITYSPDNLTNKVDVNIEFLGSGTVTLDSVINYWYRKKDDKLFKVLKGKALPQAVLNSGEIIKRPTTLEFSQNSLLDALQGKSRAEYYVDMEYIAKDKGGKRIVGKTKTPLNVICLASSVPGLNVEFEDSTIIYSPDHLSNSENINIFYLANSDKKVTIDSVINNWYKKEDSSLYKKIPSVISPSININGGSSLIRTAKLTLNNSSLVTALDGKIKAEYYINIVYIGKDQNGNRITGKSKSPLNVKCYATPQMDIDSTYYTIIPKIAVIKPVKGQTTITKSDSKVTFNGTVKLILSSSPFKNDSTYVEAINLSFQKEKKGYKVTGGTFFGEATPGAEEDLFNFKFASVLKVQVQEVSFDYNRPNKLLIKKAFAKIPVIDKKIVFKDLVIDKNGLNLKFSQQELTAFGLVFIVKNFSDVKSNTGNSKLSLGVGLRLNNKNSKEFFSGELVVQNVKGGETTVELKGANGGGKPLIRLIPTTDYLNFNSFKFVKKPKGNWAMQVGVSSSNLPIYSKISKDPINSFFEYEKSGKMTGKVEFVNEPKHGYDKNDKSVFEIGKLGAIDLTYLGFKIEQVQEITTVDSKPDTSWVFDFGKSQIGISADLYLASKGKKLNDLTNAIYFGEPGYPGITIDFEGNVQPISLKMDKKLDLGPIFLHMTTLAVTPDPFELGFTGGIGVAMENVFSGEVIIENLIIDDDGNFKNLNQAVKGGNLSIVKFLEVKIKKLQFSSTPTTFTYSKNTGSSTAKTSLQVDNYFLMEGASLTFGKSGAAGDSLKRLLIYETSKQPDGSGGNTNFILNEGKLSIKNAIDLTIDIEYVKGSQDEHLGVGGSVNLFSNGKSSGYGGTVYGEIGNRINGTDTTNYWGFYVQANLGKTGIPLGPVNLTGVGGGFFYHPSKENIQKVTSLANFTPIKISGVDPYGKPKSATSQKWALFLYASMSVGGSDFINGKALITVTDSYFKLNAEVKAISGKAHGKAYLNINWSQEFVEGKFQFGIDLVIIKAYEKNNYFQFYAYNKSKWGVMGKTDIRCFLIKTTSDIYVGNQGFLFDFALEESIDLYVLSGGFRIDAMTWWRKNVNWGIYASGKAWGDVLGGLIGAEIGVEGALISNPFLIYVGGHLKVKVVWVTVFNGRAWITISGDGLDGGTGGNAKFDKLIADARNVGKQMKKDMEDMQKELIAAYAALYKLSDAQRTAAGKGLIQLSAWAGGEGIGAIAANLYKYLFEHDLYVKTISETVDVTKQVGGEGSLKKVFNMIWNSQANNLYQLKTKLSNDSSAIANAINDIQSLESDLNALLNKKDDLMSGELPTLSELSKLKSPVTARTFVNSTMTINDSTIQVSEFEYTLDSAASKTLLKTVDNQKKELEEYQKKLVSMVGEYLKKLNEIRDILYNGNSSVASLAEKYADTYDKISNYTLNFVDYLKKQNDWAYNQSNKLSQLQPAILRDLDDQTLQAGWVTPNKFNKICKQRINLINGLIQIGVAKNFAPPLDSISKKNYRDMGKELYYNIPLAGFNSVSNETPVIRDQFMKTTKANNDLYFAKWNGFTMQSDKVYSREAKLYTILYDLLDQLSFEAGTRKIEKASSGDLAVDTGSWSTAQNNLIPFVASDGVVSISTYTTSSPIVSTTFEPEGSTFEQIVESGALNTSTGTNNSQNPVYTGKITKKGEWAKDWDFEKERKTVKKILEIPKITQFSGNAYSDKNTMGYSKLTLNWGAEHPIGIAEYSFAIEGYTEPVNVSDLSSGETTGDETVNNADEFNMWDNVGGLFLGDYFTQNNGDNNSQNVDATGTGNNDHADVSEATLVDDQPSHIWFTVGQHNKIVLPFLMSINDEGTYNVAVRARGAGGYTITRTGTINIEYSGGTNKTTGKDFDWSTRTSSLETSDQTPPTTPSVNDGGDTTSSLNLLIVKWYSTDYESGIQEYQYQVAYDNGNASGNLKEVTPWISAGGQTELNIRLNEQLIPCKKYYVLVKAKNGVGMWSSIGRSNGIELNDPTPPTKPLFISNRMSGSRKNKVYVTTLNDSLLSANWYPALDPESGIIGYLFALGTTEGASDVITWCAVKSTSLSLDKTQLDKLLNIKLQKNATYYFSVKAMNGIGIVGDASHQAVVVN